MGSAYETEILHRIKGLEIAVSNLKQEISGLLGAVALGLAGMTFVMAGVIWYVLR